MVKKSSNITQPKYSSKKKTYKNSLKLISPLFFTPKNNFIYIIKNYTFFQKFCKDLNKYKPTENEIVFLKNNLDNIDFTFHLMDEKYNNNQVIDYFQKLFKHIKKVNYEKSEKIKIFNRIFCLKLLT